MPLWLPPGHRPGDWVDEWRVEGSLSIYGRPPSGGWTKPGSIGPRPTSMLPGSRKPTGGASGSTRSPRGTSLASGSVGRSKRSKLRRGLVQAHRSTPSRPCTCLRLIFFATADKRFAVAIGKVRDAAPVPLGEPILLPGGANCATALVADLQTRGQQRVRHMPEAWPVPARRRPELPQLSRNFSGALGRPQRPLGLPRVPDARRAEMGARKPSTKRYPPAPS